MLLLAEVPSRQSEYLEVGFGQTVPRQSCLTRHFKISARQIQTWIDIALKQMKDGRQGKVMAQQNPAFSEVLAALRTEEFEPTYSALARRQERYPEFHNDLEDYFANWATSIFDQSKVADIDVAPDSNEFWLADFGAAPRPSPLPNSSAKGKVAAEHHLIS